MEDKIQIFRIKAVKICSYFIAKVQKIHAGFLRELEKIQDLKDLQRNACLLFQKFEKKLENLKVSGKTCGINSFDRVESGSRVLNLIDQDDGEWIITNCGVYLVHENAGSHRFYLHNDENFLCICKKLSVCFF
jgi:hypothetical protein